MFTDRRTNRTFLAPLALMLVIAGMTAACDEKNTYVPPPPPKVTVAKPVQKPVTDYLEFTGNIAAVQTVELRARVEGYLEHVFFQDGDLVTKGEQLFQIEQAQYIAAVDAAKADLARAQAAFKQAKLTAERRRQAGRSGAISKQQVDEAQAIQEGQAAEVLAKKAALETAQLSLGYTKIFAPFDGRIGRRLKDPGNLVGAGEQTLLAEVNQIEPVYVYFTINERALLPIMEKRDKAPPGTEAQRKTQPLFLGLATDEGYPHEGYLDFAAITLDPNTGTLQLRGVFKNPNRKLLPGLFAKIRGPVGENKDAMLVAQQAVGYDQQGEYVMVVGADDTVERRGVEQGPISDGMRVITKGLKGDERVIVDGLLRAIPGRKVTPVTEQASAKGIAQPDASKAAAPTKTSAPPPEPKTPSKSQ